ncbi:MAG: aminotransferase [Alphaproteobacteria bacterium]
MTLNPNSPEARDAAHHLHPYTQLRALEQDGPLLIARAEGVHVYDTDGKAYIEGLAGLWCTALGFSEQRLVAAARRQMETLPFYHSFSAKAPAVIVDLAEKLTALAPIPDAHAFFANSGSEANDTAVKMVWYYNNALGRPEKKKIVSRRRGYHGVTVAAASLTGMAYAQTDFDVPLPFVRHVTSPHGYRESGPDERADEFAARLAREINDLIEAEGPETVAAFIAEPVQGAGGVIIPPERYFADVQAVLRKHDVLMIADEVICGFGRTGNWWGSQTFGIQPDIMTMAKQLTSAYVPMSAVLVSDPIYQVLADNSAKLGVFGTGYTYSGHPVAAAVALETLRIYAEEDIVGQVRAKAPAFRAAFDALADHPLVGEARSVGLIGAVELTPDKAGRGTFPASDKVGARVVSAAQRHGLIVRTLPGDIVAVCPPMIIAENEMMELFRRFTVALDEIYDEVRAA